MVGGRGFDVEVDVTEWDIRDVPAYEWDSERAVSYEVALETLGDAVATYTALVHQEKSKPVPDAEKIAVWEAEITKAATRRQTLDHKDRERIRQVTDEYAAVVRRLDDQIEPL